MTTQAPPRFTEQDAVRAPAGGATVPLQAPEGDPILDAFPFLDVRSRGRAIAEGVAPAGRYLALGDGARTQLLPLETSITHIGRSLTSDVRFDDPRVSRTHAIVARHGRSARLLDNRSANGTFLNGQRVLAATLRHGDVIRVGPLVAQYLEIL